MAMDSTDAPQIIEHINKSVTFTPYDTRWVPCSARFAVLGMNPRGTGVIKVFEMSRGELKVAAEVSRHAVARPPGAPDLSLQAEKTHGFKCGTFGASSLEERHLATGDYNGMLNIWCACLRLHARTQGAWQ